MPGFGYGFTVRGLLRGGLAPLTVGPGGPVLWLAPESLDAIGDTNPIATWPDSSLSGNDATQATAADRPVVAAGVLDGYAGALFDGTSDFLVLDSEISDASDFDIWMVFKLGAAGAVRMLLAGGVSENDYVSHDTTDPTPLVYASSAGSTTVTTAGFAASAVSLARLARDGADALVGEKNGADITTGTPSNAGDLKVGQIGERLGVTPSNFNGHLIELLIYPMKLGVTDRTILLNYFGIKYPTLGITLGGGPPPGARVTVGGQTRGVVGGGTRIIV